jgi:hypothetical protein
MAETKTPPASPAEGGVFDVSMPETSRGEARTRRTFPAKKHRFLPEKNL